MREAAPVAGPSEPWLVYDGYCPFCSAYVRHLRLKKSVGLRLVDARAGGPAVEECRGLGFDLNQGMVLKMAGRHYYAADSLHALALLSGRSDLFNRVAAAAFSSKRRAALFYPALRAGRRAALFVLGRRGL